MTNGPHAGFDPWIGTGWKKAPLKLLLLGESHYCNYADRCPEFTINLVNNHIGGGKVRFLSKASNVIAGRRLRPDERSRFWNEIAYTNFIGEIAANMAGVAPSRELFEDWARCYEAQLNRIGPNVVFVCGERLWSNMQRELKGAVRHPENTTDATVFGVPHFIAHHPSTSITYDRWWRSLATFMARHGLAVDYVSLQMRLSGIDEPAGPVGVPVQVGQ